MLNEEYMSRFCAFISLIGTDHYDEDHNIRLFWDPIRGQFKMIEGDSIGLSFGDSNFDRRQLDISSNRIFSTLLLNPHFNYKKNQYLYKWLTNPNNIAYAIKNIESTAKLLAPYISIDVLEEQGFNFGDPQKNFDQTSRSITRFLQLRSQFLRQELEKCELRYAQKHGTLKLDVTGYSPCEDVTLQFAAAFSATIKIRQDRNLNGKLDETDPIIDFEQTTPHTITLTLPRLYPGRFRAGGLYNWHLRPAPMTYTFLFENAELVPMLQSVGAQNSITHAMLTGKETTDWSVHTTASIHPWTLPKRPNAVTLQRSGTIRLNSDWIIPEWQSIELMPGTEVLLSAGVSIVSYGRLAARGTPSQPIRFKRANPDAAWGAISLQDGGANKSSFAHCEFMGGSDNSHNHVYYPGMVNVNAVANVVFQNCEFRSNVIGDDAMRAAKSTVRLTACRFKDTNSDAIDFDYSHGTIQGCVFRRIGNDAIDLMASQPVITDSTIGPTGDKAISIGERSDPIIYNCMAEGSEIGIEIKDGSRPVILNCRISSLGPAIRQYAKNWRYSEGGKGSVYNSLLDSPQSVVQSDSHSFLFLHNCAIYTKRHFTSWPNTSLTKCSRHLHVPRTNGLPTTQPNRRIYAMLGMTSTGPQLGLLHKSTSTPPMRPEVLFTDLFRDDFKTGLAPWSVVGDGVDIQKLYDTVRIRNASTGGAKLVRRLPNPVLARGAHLLIECRCSSEPANMRVHFTGEDDPAPVEIRPTHQWQQIVVRVPDADLTSVSMTLPHNGQWVELRRITVLRPRPHSN